MCQTVLLSLAQKEKEKESSNDEPVQKFDEWPLSNSRYCKQLEAHLLDSRLVNTTLKKKKLTNYIPVWYLGIWRFEFIQIFGSLLQCNCEYASAEVSTILTGCPTQLSLNSCGCYFRVQFSPALNSHNLETNSSILELGVVYVHLLGSCLWVGCRKTSVMPCYGVSNPEAAHYLHQIGDL